MAKAKGPAPQPWQVAASATKPPGSKVQPAAIDPTGSATGGSRPVSDRPGFAGSSIPAPAPPPPPGIPTDAKGFQQYLVSKGAKIVVDGIIGPKTLAAAQQLGVQVPPNLAPPPAPAPATAPAPQPPPPSGPSPLTAAATTAAPAAPLDDATIASQFGWASWVLDNPELRAIVEQAASAQANGTPWTQGQFNTAWNNTNYAKTTSSTWQAFTQTQATRPEDAKNQVNSKVDDIQKVAQGLGITIAPDRAQAMATDAIRFNWSSTDLEKAVGNEFRYVQGGQSGTIGRQELGIKQIAGDYLVPVSDGTLQQWDQQIAASNGRLTSEDFRTYLAEQAKTLYPTLSAQIDKGLTTNQLVDPYRQIAAKELGITPESIDFTQPKWLSLISAPTDPKTGERQMMSLAGATQKIRSDETYGWDKSQNGVATYYQAGNALTSALGVRA